ncbi:YveK family protein [uncultured Clostridium sp.]|uniref:YveK family protein n=1 Tax=uncultured Clostridium sp. TaxID=59620 RepID=UPI0025F861F7|nr:Wzz/FepE/Etk N-terminal domain-containing protein [uncultured Clostridium sp.]
MTDEIRIDDFISILKKNFKLGICITFLSTILSVYIAFVLIEPVYQANTKIFVGKEATEQSDEKYSNNDVQMYQQLLKTYAELIKTNDLLEDSIRYQNYDIKSSDILKKLTVTPKADTQILEISYRNKDKVLARDILSLITDELISESSRLIPNGKLEVVETVRIPEKPISPNKKLIIIIGFSVGILLTIGIVFLKNFITDPFKNNDEIEEMLSVPVIGMIPYEK